MKRIFLILIIAGLAVAAGAQDIGSWMVHESEDIMTDETSRVYINMADVEQGALQTPAIVLRGADDVFIDWGGFRLDRDMEKLDIAIDGADPRGVPINRSSDRKAVFLKADTIQSLRDSETLAAAVVSATGRSMAARWDISGFGKALDSLK